MWVTSCPHQPTRKQRLMPRPSHKEKIVESGLAVFHEFGYHASGVQTVVDHAGVPKGSFYNHFKSKDELGLAVLDAYWHRTEDVRAILNDTSLNPLERIEAHLAAFTVTQSGCLVGNFTSEMANEPQFRDALKTVYGSWISDVAACISLGQKDGSIRDDQPARTLGEFVVTALEGSILKRKLEDNKQNVIDFRKTILAFLRAN
ncbi:TetR/AcrR family transcriptional regulator [uncultured Tateyamaria sp.]|uniref:TetR/AcrR family transcriptional regulator n=1 Tax=uncultured Tateyamaria sp. TaxID=455651 RepID=UPI00260CA77E|nr:TetR/AcrR family transcriptional regulator [uncultured Tateyamaria sp.]